MAGLHSDEDGRPKFLVLRRDGTKPDWPWFVLGARDPWAPYALVEYAVAAARGGADPAYTDAIINMAPEWVRLRLEAGDGDPDAPRHRENDPIVLDIMDGKTTFQEATPRPRLVVTLDFNAYVEGAVARGEDAAEACIIATCGVAECLANMPLDYHLVCDANVARIKEAAGAVPAQVAVFHDGRFKCPSCGTELAAGEARPAAGEGGEG